MKDGQGPSQIQKEVLGWGDKEWREGNGKGRGKPIVQELIVKVGCLDCIL